MKPFLLVTGDFVKTGGMDRANFALADYLARQGGEVHLVAHRIAPELEAYPNVWFHRVPKVAGSYWISSFLLNQAGQLQARHITRLGGRVVVNGGNCQWSDINWVHYVHAAYQPEVQTGLLRKLKTAIAHPLFVRAERQALLSAQTIIVNSERTKQDLIEHLAIPPKRIQRVYCGCDPEIFNPATLAERVELRQKLSLSLEKPMVIFIGALGDRRKGFDTLFAAWQRLCSDPDWDADLVAIGSGADQPLWQKRAMEAGLASRIHFLSFRTDVPDLLRAADCLVAPTRYEAYGLGVQEALCCGLPVIVSASAGMAERYPPELQDLLLNDPEDVEDLVDSLQKWRKNIDCYKQKVHSLSESLRSYTWDNMSRNILDKADATVLYI